MEVLRSDLEASHNFVQGINNDQKKLQDAIEANMRVRNELEELIVSQRENFSVQLNDIKEQHKQEIQRLTQENEELVSMMDNLLDKVEEMKARPYVQSINHTLNELSYQNLVPLDTEIEDTSCLSIPKMDYSQIASTISREQLDSPKVPKIDNFPGESKKKTLDQIKTSARLFMQHLQTMRTVRTQFKNVITEETNEPESMSIRIDTGNASASI